MAGGGNARRSPRAHPQVASRALEARLPGTAAHDLSRRLAALDEAHARTSPRRRLTGPWPPRRTFAPELATHAARASASSPENRGGRTFTARADTRRLGRTRRRATTGGRRRRGAVRDDAAALVSAERGRQRRSHRTPT